MPLGLVPRARTQGQRWPFQEVHHCATHVIVAYRKKIDRIYTALTTKLLSANFEILEFPEYIMFKIR